VGRKGVGRHHAILVAARIPVDLDLALGSIHRTFYTSYTICSIHCIYYIHIFTDGCVLFICVCNGVDPNVDTRLHSVIMFVNFFSDSVRILVLKPLSRWLVDPPRVVLRDVVPSRSFRFPARRDTTQLPQVVHHLLMILLLDLGRFLLVLIVDVVKRVVNLQRLRGRVEGGFHV